MILSGPEQKQLRELMLVCFPECELVERMLLESERSIQMNRFVPRNADLDDVFDAVFENVPHHALLKAIIGYEATSPALLKFCQEHLRDTDPVALSKQLENYSPSDLADMASAAGFAWENLGHGEADSIVKAAKDAKRLEDLVDTLAKAGRSPAGSAARQFTLPEQLARQLRRKGKIRVDDLSDGAVGEMLWVARTGVEKVLDAKLESSALVDATRRLKERSLSQKGGGEREKLALAAMWIGVVLDSTVERAALDETLEPLEKVWARVTARRFPIWAKVAAGVAGVMVVLGVGVVAKGYSEFTGLPLDLKIPQEYKFPFGEKKNGDWQFYPGGEHARVENPMETGLLLDSARPGTYLLNPESNSQPRDFDLNFDIFCEKSVRKFPFFLRAASTRGEAFDPESGLRFEMDYNSGDETWGIAASSGRLELKECSKQERFKIPDYMHGAVAERDFFPENEIRVIARVRGGGIRLEFDKAVTPSNPHPSYNYRDTSSRPWTVGAIGLGTPDSGYIRIRVVTLTPVESTLSFRSFFVQRLSDGFRELAVSSAGVVNVSRCE